METDRSKKEAKQPSQARTIALRFVLLIGVMSFVRWQFRPLTTGV